jgi:hypothetical protein
MKNLIISFFFVCSFWCANSQEIKPEFSVKYSPIKGIHARALAFSEGEVYIGTNTGDLFKINEKTKEISLFEKKTFKEYRDILVLSESVLILSSGDSSAIIEFSLKDKEIKRIQMFNGIFLDGFAQNKDSIVTIGDPVLDEFAMFSASISKLTFHPIQSEKAFSGEAAYAASGSTVLSENEKFYFFSGGMKNRMFIYRDSAWTESLLPFSPCETCGTYSATINGKFIFIAGGNYLEPNKTTDNFYFSKNLGKTWKTCKKGPTGFRSSIVHKGSTLFAAGTNGLDISLNNGRTWKKVNNSNYVALLIVHEYLIASGINGTLDFYKLSKWKN